MMIMDHCQQLFTHPGSGVKSPIVSWGEVNGGHDGDGGEDADGGQQQLSQTQPHPPRVQPLVAGADHAGLRIIEYNKKAAAFN